MEPGMQAWRGSTATWRMKMVTISEQAIVLAELRL